MHNTLDCSEHDTAMYRHNTYILMRAHNCVLCVYVVTCVGVMQVYLMYGIDTNVVVNTHNTSIEFTLAASETVQMPCAKIAPNSSLHSVVWAYVRMGHR